MKKKLILATASGMLAVLPLQANLVVDGSFNGSLTTETITPATVTIPGWFDQVDPGVGAPSISGGTATLAPVDSFAGQIYENLTGLTVGHTYNISFDAKSGSPTGGIVAVNFDHAGVAAQFSTIPGTSWTTYQFTSTVAELNANNSVTLAFTGTVFDFDTGGSFGALSLDNVSVTDTSTVSAVPEPTTIAAGALLLVPFGVSALRVLRKNRKA